MQAVHAVREQRPCVMYVSLDGTSATALWNLQRLQSPTHTLQQEEPPSLCSKLLSHGIVPILLVMKVKVEMEKKRMAHL